MSNKEIIYGIDGKPLYEVIKTDHQNQAFVFERVYGSLPLLRVGFLSPVPPRHLSDPEFVHDSRPIAWPVYHPYWVVKIGSDANIMMTYVESLDEIAVFWPEATEVTVFEEGCTQYAFNSNFPKPSWLAEVHATDFTVRPRKIGAFKVTDLATGKSIIGFSDDVDYAVQLNNHQLEYGVHADAEFQDIYRSWEELEITYYKAKDLAAAECYAQSLQDFDTDNGEFPVSNHF